jgi:AcrR family transcriptional regulator
MPSISPTQPKRSRQNTHEKILETATRIFIENGYTRATTRIIAQESGVTEITLFRHFGSKENLFEEVVESYAAVPNITHILDNQLTGQLPQDLTRIGQAFMRILLQRRQALVMVLNEAEHFPEAKKIIAKVPQQLHGYLENIFLEKINSGEMRALDAHMLARLFWGTLLAFSVTSGLMDDEELADEEQFVANFVDVFINGTIQD